jgi:hypothetical protein
VTRVLFMSHPVASPDVATNVKRALDWLRFLRASEPECVVIAPWLASLASGEDDGDPAQRERGLRDCEAVIARCDGIILCGGRVSSGMQRELDAAIAADLDVDDLTSMGVIAPTEPRPGVLDGSVQRAEDRSRGKARVTRAELDAAARAFAALPVMPTLGKSPQPAEAVAAVKKWQLARTAALGRLERAARGIR